MKLAMLIPTRQRPKAAWEAAGEALRLARGDTRVLVCVDGDDDPGYHDEGLSTPGLYRMYCRDRRGLVGTLNRWSMFAADAMDGVTHVGFMGDDHRSRTEGWDAELMEAAGDGMAFGNDLLRGAELPTAIVMNADIVRALGRMAPGSLYHMYCDDYWLALGTAVGIRYCPHVIVEHLHPAAGKAQLDESYRESNHPDRYAADKAAWERFVAEGLLNSDIAVVRNYRASR